MVVKTQIKEGVKMEASEKRNGKNPNFLPPEFPTPYYCPSEDILQAAEYRTHFKIQSETETNYFV